MNKGSTKKGGTVESETLSLHPAYKPAQMKKSILEIYALSVCFVTLLCFVIALGIGIHDLIQIGNPEFTMNPYEYERHQSNQAFGPSPRLMNLAFAPAVSTEPSESSSEELTEQREKSYQGASVGTPEGIAKPDDCRDRYGDRFSCFRRPLAPGQKDPGGYLTAADIVFPRSNQAWRSTVLYPDGAEQPMETGSKFPALLH